MLKLGFARSARFSSFGLAVLLTITAGHARVVSAAHSAQAGRAPQGPALKILVIEGEDAINIVQQKTAVAPVVEIRDRNDQPVSGAVVTFAIRGGRASFSGARTLTLTTNAAGRAAATGLTPTGSGALQITASAAFQGQTAVATIAQTNVMSIAGTTAAGAGGGGAGGGSTAGGAAGGAGGGGLSTTTLAVVGGAVAGGAVAAKEVLGGNDFTHYSGAFSGSVVSNPGGGNCFVTVMHTGTVLLDIKTASDGTVTGTGGVNQTRTVTQQTGCGGPNQQVGATEPDGCCSPPPSVSGTTGNLTFGGSHPGGSGTNWTYAFNGALNGAEITGTFTLTVTSPGSPNLNPSFPVTLR